MPEETKDEGEVKGPELVDLPHIRSKDFQSVYSNFAQCGRSAWDIAIQFGQLGESEPGKPAVIELTTVTMTPSLAKAFLGVLNAQIKQYELENGEVQLPGIIRQAVEEQKAARAKSQKESVKSVEPDSTTSPT